jgi:hypothetical protein
MEQHLAFSTVDLLLSVQITNAHISLHKVNFIALLYPDMFLHREMYYVEATR